MWCSRDESLDESFSETLASDESLDGWLARKFYDLLQIRQEEL